MTTMSDWSGGIYPWDMAKCGCCLVMHTNSHLNTISCSKPQEHAAMMDVASEQGLAEFYTARIQDARNAHSKGYFNPVESPTPLTDKWLTDNREKAVAIRELFRDLYDYNPVPTEQTELTFEPATHE